MYVCVCVCIYIYIYIYMCVCVCVCVYVCCVFVGLDNKMYKMQGTYEKIKNRNCQPLNSLRPKYINPKSNKHSVRS